jgi:hypothetical protein
MAGGKSGTPQGSSWLTACAPSSAYSSWFIVLAEGLSRPSAAPPLQEEMAGLDPMSIRISEFWEK